MTQRNDELSVVAHELAIDEAMVRVFAQFPDDSWRSAELRDIIGAALARPARRGWSTGGRIAM